MDQVGLTSRVRCFYLGLLPRATDKRSLAALLKAFGKVLRLRLARHKGDQQCWGYGYVFIELVCSERAFAARALAGNPPIYAKEIPGPKHLGSEHTKTLRRCVRAVPEAPCARQELLDCLASFGALELEVSEAAGPGLPDAGPPRVVKSLFAMFADAEAAGRLAAARNAGAPHTFLARLAVLGLQESGADAWEPPYFLKAHAGSDAVPLEFSSERSGPDSGQLPRVRASEPRDMAKLASTFARQQLGSPAPGAPVERRKKQPTMNFQGRRLACTINSNQLSRYSRVFGLLHSGKNLRYNLRAVAQTRLEPQAGNAAGRRI